MDTVDHILNGNGSQAGLKQVIAERNQADLGADGLGRLVVPAAAGSVVSVSEDSIGSPFGLKLSGVNSTFSGATVSGPTGSPASISVDLGATNPNNGDSVTYTFTLPDGSTQTLQLQATTANPPGANQFAIGATPAETATNLQAALTAGISQIGSTSLSAASAMAASNDFFGEPPQRVNGPPFDTATSQVGGHAGQYRVLVYRRQQRRVGPIDPDRANRSVDDGVLWDAGERAGDPLGRAERCGARGDELLGKRCECRGELQRA